jgi:DNA-binding Lrp family transcriptional regulator
MLIKCKTGFENQIIEELVKMPEVQEVKGVFGDWDIFVRLETKSQTQLEDIITQKIRRIPNITSTNSLSPIPSQGGK